MCSIIYALHTAARLSQQAELGGILEEIEVSVDTCKCAVRPVDGACEHHVSQTFSLQSPTKNVNINVTPPKFSVLDGFSAVIIMWSVTVSHVSPPKHLTFLSDMNVTLKSANK